MNILFINLPYYGHFVPTVGLVQELIKKGCQVTYLMPYDWESKVLESGAEFQGYPNHKKLSEQIKNAYSSAEQIIAEYDLVIYEQFFFLGKHLAEKYNKSVVRIFTAPVTNEKLMREYIQSGGPLGIFKYKWIAKSWTREILEALHIEAVLQTDNWLDEIVYNPPELNLIYTLQEYQPFVEEFDKNQYRFLGPSVYERKEHDWNFIKGERPLIYISLGTVVKGADSFFQNCIETFRGEDVDVILSTGHQFQKKLKSIPGNVHVFRNVSQIEVLKQADVFVTHGGMNSISEAMVHAVPMVVIPFMADQPVNARRVEELGLGKKLDYRALKQPVLKQMVFSVLTDVKIRENMLQFQNLSQKAPGNKGAAELILEISGNQVKLSIG